MTTKKPSRREALRAFHAKPQPKPQPAVCRRLTPAEVAWWMTKDEVEREFRWARTLNDTLDELAAFRERGGQVH